MLIKIYKCITYWNIIELKFGAIDLISWKDQNCLGLKLGIALLEILNLVFVRML